MKKIKKLGLFFGIVALVSSIGCVDEAAEKKTLLAQLEGRWEIEEGYRSGKQTRTFADLFFEFLPEQKLAYNLSGARTEVPYTLVEQTIKPENDRLNMDFQIEMITDDLLTLSSRMRDTDFKFVLRKAVPTEVGEKEKEEKVIQ